MRNATVLLLGAALHFGCVTPANRPTVSGGSISNLSVEHNVPARQFALRPASANQVLDNRTLEHRGNVVSFNVRIYGLEGKPCPVRWAVYRTAAGPARVYEDTPLTLTAEAFDDRASFDVWVPLPERQGNYFVRIELLDPRGRHRLTYADTDVFTINSVGLSLYSS